MDKIDTIRVSVGRETNENELSVFKDSLESLNGISFKIDKNYIRLSETELPFIVEFTISAIFGGIMWDSLKIGIQKIFTSNKIKREGSIIILQENSEIIISNNYKIIREEKKELIFENIDNLFEYLKNKEKNK